MCLHHRVPFLTDLPSVNVAAGHMLREVVVAAIKDAAPAPHGRG